MIVYFIVTEDGKFVKIGKTSKDPKTRLSALQVGNANKLKLLATLETDDIYKEKELHNEFESLRVNGEWFKFKGELRKFIVKLIKLDEIMQRKEDNLVKTFLEKYNIPSKDLAYRLGVSPAFVSSVLSGTRKLSEKHIEKLKHIQVFEGSTTYTVSIFSPTDKIIRLLIENEEKVDEVLTSIISLIVTQKDNSLYEDLYKDLQDYFHV